MFACAQWGAVGEFAASRHGVLTRKQAAVHGMSAKVIARLLAAGHLTEPLPGVLTVVGSPTTWRQSLLIATLGSNRAGVAAFTSAAALHEIDGFKGDSIHLLVPSWRRGFGGDVSLHIGPRDHQRDITEIDGIRCTGIARTLCDLGSVCTIDQTRIAFEWAWRSAHSLTWIRLTAERLHRPGQKGTGVILDLLDAAAAAGHPTDSTLEVELEQCLGEIPGLVRQFEIRDGRGAFVARPDFAIPDVKLAIEAHSRRHHFGPSAVERDEDREHAAQAQGWQAMYFGKAQMRSPGRVRAKVLAVIEQRRRQVVSNHSR